MINIILMAGHGKRFTDAGYTQSKPLIPVSGKPMILQAIKSMPNVEKWVFVVREEHLQEKEILDTLKSVGEEVRILVDPNPIGQLNSCLVAKDHYPEDEPMFVGACDLGMVYDKEKLKELIERPDAPDMVVFSFTKQPNLPRNPHAWGWLKQDEKNIVNGVSVKIPISDNPYNDHAIVGSFIFKNGKIFKEIANELISRGENIKGEYYIDSMINVANDMGYKVVSFPVKYIGWGVPADLEEYNYWEDVIKNAKGKKEYSFWKEYFENE